MKSIAYSLYSLIETKNQKIDFRTLERLLIDEYGRLTTIGEHFRIASVNNRFPEREETQKYEFTTELTFENYEVTDFCVIFGECGLFLKYKKSLDFASVNSVINSLEEFVSIAKLCLYTPIGKVYYSDGITYIRNDASLWSAKGAGVRYELFNDKKETE